MLEARRLAAGILADDNYCILRNNKKEADAGKRKASVFLEQNEAEIKIVNKRNE